MIPSGKHGVAKCRNCGMETHIENELEIKFQTKQEENKDIPVIEQDRSSLPIIERDCPVCGHEKCYYWFIQTRASDEPPTQFFRCLNCNHTWREYK